MLTTKLDTIVGGVTGGQAAVLMDFDGIPIDVYGHNDETDAETLGMELSVVLKEIRKVAQQLEAGATEEVTVRTERFTTVVRIIDDNYFLALALTPEGNLGKARYLLRLYAPKLREELL